MQTGLTLTVGPNTGDFVGSTNTALQAAVDAAARAGGGVVSITEGVYTMHDSLHLRSGVTVRGEGAGTVLRKAACVSSPILGYLGYGHYDVSLVEPDKFQVGMGVYIADNNAGGFYTTVATLTWRDGERFGISRFLNHDYSGENAGMVLSLFPVISGIEIENAAIENLAIDGNKAENVRLNGCRGGGIFLLQAHNIAMRGLAVRDYFGDGISFQQCRDTLVEDCLLEGQTGCGLHPGSGSVGPIMRRVTARNNGSDGIFFCLRVSYGLCEACVITGNGGDGISIGGRDTDNLIHRCVIRDNAGHGVYFRKGPEYMGGNRNRIEHCEVGPNGKSGEFYLENTTADIEILDNRITPGSEPRVAVWADDQCRRITVAGNDLIGEGAELASSACLAVEMMFTRPASLLPVGPDARPVGAARHLSAEG
ncbi:MAG: right-handed parallel beta-helix repeat-containing protein [Armatimonadota bacterium]